MSAWCCAYTSGPIAISVCLSSSTGDMFENWPTLSCGRNWSGLSTWMLSSFIRARTAFCVDALPSSVHACLLSTSNSTRTTAFAGSSYSSVSTHPLRIGCPRSSFAPPEPWTHSLILSPRSVTPRRPPSPTHIAHTMLDLPVPFGPMMQFSFVPTSAISASRYDMKLWRRLRTIAPRL